MNKKLLKKQQEETDRLLGETEKEHEKELRLWQAEADKELEELVQIWQRGEFPALYWSVFWEDPPTVTIPERYRQ